LTFNWRSVQLNIFFGFVRQRFPPRISRFSNYQLGVALRLRLKNGKSIKPVRSCILVTGHLCGKSTRNWQVG